MKSALLSLGLLLATALPSQAACYADYRAQQSGPLRFHYGVAQLPESACGNPAAAAAALRERLSRNGWTLVDVLSTFDESGLGSRQGNAGQFFLRF